jgi:putative membrane protein
MLGLGFLEVYLESPNSLLFSILHWLLSALALLLTSRIVSGFKVRDFPAALWAAIIIGIANAIIWPVLIILTLPVNILTLGLFTFVVNGAVLKICAALLPGFDIETWGAAILGSIVLSILNMVLHYAFI